MDLNLYQIVCPVILRVKKKTGKDVKEDNKSSIFLLVFTDISPEEAKEVRIWQSKSIIAWEKKLKIYEALFCLGCINLSYNVFCPMIPKVRSSWVCIVAVQIG